ncbi:MAG: serine--tRNA ligase [Candidatus Aenigmatarchaeota archaeon]
MLDIKLLRERPDIVKSDLEKRGEKARAKDVDEFLRLDEQKRKLLYKTEQDRKARNAINKEIARMRAEKKDITFNKKQIATINARIAQNEAKLAKLDARLRALRYSFPNILHESVPKGKDESDNKPVRTWGRPPKLGFKPLGHSDLMERLDLVDLPRAAKIAGARFFFLKNELALLDLALMRFGLDMLVKKGYTPVQPPYLMKREPYEGVVDLTDFETVMYKVENEDLYLIATSEHPLVSMHMKETIPEGQLPLRYAGFSANFRKEAGTHGKDTKGIFRVHQFNKVEQLVLTKPEDSWREHERLAGITEELFQKLEIPYRLVNVCTGDIGTVAAKKYDLEAWMPAQAKYREMASCSNCTDYQSRRLAIKYGREGKGPIGPVHTLNSTAVVSRILTAILENYQQADGSVAIPHRLREYMGGLKKIERS